MNEARLGDGSTILISSDISAQKRVETALRQSEQRLKDFVSAAADWFWEMDANLNFSYVSVDNIGITGMPVEAHIGLTRRETNPENVTEEELVAHGFARNVSRLATSVFQEPSQTANKSIFP